MIPVSVSQMYFTFHCKSTDLQVFSKLQSPNSPDVRPHEVFPSRPHRTAPALYATSNTQSAQVNTFLPSDTLCNYPRSCGVTEPRSAESRLGILGCIISCMGPTPRRRRSWPGAPNRAEPNRARPPFSAPQTRPAAGNTNRTRWRRHDGPQHGSGTGGEH